MPICQVCGKEINWLESLDFGNGQKFCSDKCYQTILPNLPKNLLYQILLQNNFMHIWYHADFLKGFKNKFPMS